MADVVFPIEDDRILTYIQEHLGLEVGKAAPNIEVTVVAQPPVTNSAISHTVEVKLTYGLEIGEISKLAGL